MRSSTIDGRGDPPGGSGDDYLEVSPDATGYVVLDGGSGDDFLLNNSRIQGNVAATQSQMSCSTNVNTPPTGATPLASFGRPTAAGDPRQVQLGLRLNF